MNSKSTNEINNFIFNGEQKRKFLLDSIQRNVISEKSSNNYIRIFINTKRYEEKNNKDICEFSLKELEAVMYGFNSNNLNTVESYARIISSYLNWCVNEGLINENHLASLSTLDFRKYLTQKEVYFTDKHLRRYEDSCVNYQDAVILRLLFSGAGGKQFSELSNLSKHDIYWDENEINLKNVFTYDENGLPLKYTERKLKVDDRMLFLIEKALGEKIYYKSNGDMAEASNIRPYTDLIDNDYVIRPSITRTDDSNVPVNQHVIYRRIKTISDALGIEELTAKYIQRSGMIYFGNSLIKDYDKLSLDDLKIIANRFNTNSYYNLRGYITTEVIRETYNNY